MGHQIETQIQQVDWEIREIQDSQSWLTKRENELSVITEKIGTIDSLLSDIKSIKKSNIENNCDHDSVKEGETPNVRKSKRLQMKKILPKRK